MNKKKIELEMSKIESAIRTWSVGSRTEMAKEELALLTARLQAYATMWAACKEVEDG